MNFYSISFKFLYYVLSVSVCCKEFSLLMTFHRVTIELLLWLHRTINVQENEKDVM